MRRTLESALPLAERGSSRSRRRRALAVARFFYIGLASGGRAWGTSVEGAWEPPRPESRRLEPLGAAPWGKRGQCGRRGGDPRDWGFAGWPLGVQSRPWWSFIRQRTRVYTPKLAAGYYTIASARHLLGRRSEANFLGEPVRCAGFGIGPPGILLKSEWNCRRS